MNSLIRWAGGKGALVSRILPLLTPPPRGCRYVEPFLGGGAVYFATRASGWQNGALLADLNPDLCQLYTTVQRTPEVLVELLDGATCNKADYYDVRALDPDRLLPGARAARAYYLLRGCFNGLWRVNGGGRMNVPFAADREGKPVLDVQALASAHRALAGADIVCTDFRNVLACVRAGDRVYIDSPYYGGFVQYTAQGWTLEDVYELENAASRVALRGARVVVSLSDTAEHRDAFADGWNIHRVEAPRRMPSDGNRTPADELLLSMGTG